MAAARKVLGMDVTVYDRDTVKVGFGEFSREQLSTLLELMDAEPKPPKQEFPVAKDGSNGLSSEEAIGVCKERFNLNFMAVRSLCNYSGKGFYLGKNSGWKIVTDSLGGDVLIRAADEIK